MPAPFYPMDYEIIIPSDWTYRDSKRGPQTVRAGTYRIPRDLKDAIARMAIEQGKGERREISDVPAKSEEAKPAKRKYTRRQKGPAPENKSLGSAPDNKSTLV